MQRATDPIAAIPVATLLALVAGGAMFMAVLVVAMRAMRCRRHGRPAHDRADWSSSAPHADAALHVATFDERPLAEASALMERLIEQGAVSVEPTAPDCDPPVDLPDFAGPVFRSLAARFRRITLVEVGISIDLHHGERCSDTVGGWGLRVEPAELDLRLLDPSGPRADAPLAADGDTLLDATWSPRGAGEAVRHSTLVHFVVRSIRGARAGMQAD